jgi:hypothetical protein
MFALLEILAIYGSFEDVIKVSASAQKEDKPKPAIKKKARKVP